MLTNPLAKLWVGKCTIYEYQSVTDPDTYQTTQSLVTVVRDEPCRVSYTRETITDNNDGVPNTYQLTMLFIRPELDIKAGSVIEITQRGRTIKYKGSSTTAKYSNHQEVVLELYEEKA